VAKFTRGIFPEAHVRVTCTPKSARINSTNGRHNGSSSPEHCLHEGNSGERPARPTNKNYFFRSGQEGKSGRDSKKGLHSTRLRWDMRTNDKVSTARGLEKIAEDRLWENERTKGQNYRPRGGGTGESITHARSGSRAGFILRCQKNARLPDFDFALTSPKEGENRKRYRQAMDGTGGVGTLYEHFSSRTTLNFLYDLWDACRAGKKQGRSSYIGKSNVKKSRENATAEVLV